MKNTVLFFAIVLFLAACRPDPKIILSTSDGHSHNHLDLTIPAGLPPMSIPSDNPLTVEGVDLGRRLFYDNILSANNTMNCGSCHQLNRFFVDSNKRFSVGIDNIEGTRNSMPLFNIGYSKGFFWDGGATSLEAQVAGPITNPIELHDNLENVVGKIQRHPLYPSLFKKAFGSDKITTRNLFFAIAQFERTLLSANSKFDQWRQGKAALTEAEQRGLNVYLDEKKGDCVHCHTFGSTFTDYEFRNTGLDSIPIDKGRGLITLNPSDDGKFKTPSLRNIELTAPYMHDGRFPSLESCIEHYNKNYNLTPNLDPVIRDLPKNRMTNQDVQDLVAFLKTLTDFSFLNNKAFDKP
jgi:cytochrome c peroxidase